VSSANNALVNTSSFNNVSVTPTVALGANIDALHDWSLNNTFVDMIKQARPFIALTPSPSGPASADPHGWPTQDFQVIVQTGALNTAHVYNGVYKLSFSGQATLSTDVTPGGSISNVVYNPTTNTSTADVTVNASDSNPNWYIIIDFRNTNGGVKNIRLIRPGYAADTTQVFTNEFLKEIQPFSTLRFMDFTQTNNSAVVNWADRSQVT